MIGIDGASRFAAAAAAMGIAVESVVYPEGTRTARDAAQAIGCALSQIAKSLLLMGPDGSILAITAGHNRVDLARVSNLVGGLVRLANADEARAASGYSIGGTPPFGHPEPISAYLDCDLLQHETVYGAAGAADRCFPIASVDLQRVARAVVADFVVRELPPSKPPGLER